MTLYMVGDVKAGSSSSLCPRRRYTTRSITTSLRNLRWYASASLTARATSSTRSPLTCKTGAAIIFARSVA